MALVLSKKNEIRSSLIRYHIELVSILNTFQQSYRIHEFDSDLEDWANQIKKDMRDSRHINQIRKALKGAKKQIIDVAKNSTIGNRLDSKTFFTKYFGGIPLDSESFSEAPYDLVIEIEPNNVVGWIFAPSRTEDIDNSEIMNFIQNDFQMKCSGLVVKYQTENNIEDTEEDKTENIQESSVLNDASVFEVIENVPSEQEPQTIVTVTENPKIPIYIGRIQFDKKHQMLLKEDRKDDQIHGYIKEENASSVSPNDILALDSNDKEDDSLILVSVVKLGVNRQHTATNFQSYSELGIEALFRPILEKTGDYFGKLRPRDLTGYQVRKPYSEEYALITNTPSSGLPLGKLDEKSGQCDFFFPFEPNNELLCNSIYQSVFIAGIQGSGKTNALKFMVQALSSYEQIEMEKRPAVIILDGEKSFTDFTSNEQMPDETREFFSKHAIGDADYQTFTISEKPESADSTLSLRALSYNDLVYLIPEMESRTENIILPILRFAYENIKNRGLALTIENLRNEAMYQVRTSGLIHQSQRPAIARSLQSIELDMFDQHDKIELLPELLFQPGKISVLNIHDLDNNRRRIVALYIQQILNRFKMENSNKYPGVILVLDEAEKLFPKNSTKREKDFVERIAERTEEVTNRGRKRHYGVFIVSHLPSEVSPKVVALANTKMAFRCPAGTERWISSTFGKEFVDEIKDLEVGTCRIKVNISNPHQRPINARVHMPNMAKKEVSELG